MSDTPVSGHNSVSVEELLQLIERKRDAGDMAEEEAVLEMYREAIKMPTGPRNQPTNGDT